MDRSAFVLAAVALVVLAVCTLALYLAWLHARLFWV